MTGSIRRVSGTAGHVMDKVAAEGRARSASGVGSLRQNVAEGTDSAVSPGKRAIAPNTFWEVMCSRVRGQ